MKSYNITVVGSGYVGMAMAVLLAQHNDVIVLDIDADRVKKINKKETTISDPMIEDFLKTGVNKNEIIQILFEWIKSLKEKNLKSLSLSLSIILKSGNKNDLSKFIGHLS